jgi:hypothetical protein
MSNIPTDPKLWKRIQRLVRGDVRSIRVDGEVIEGPRGGRGFVHHPSAYSNGWAAKLYKRLGGGWKKSASTLFLHHIAVRVADLRSWFNKEDWVAIDTQGNIVGECSQSRDRERETRGGQDPLKCLPRARALNMTKKERASAARRKKRVEKRSPRSKNPTRAPT